MHVISAFLVTVLMMPVCADDRPIPQDPERDKQRSHEYLIWNRRTLAEAYETAGKKDEKWNEPARRALEATARLFSDQITPLPTLEMVHEGAKQAIDSGCDDPLILYLYARSSFKPNSPGRAEVERRARVAATAMQASAYPVFRRMAALNFAAVQLGVTKDLTDERREEIIRLLETSLSLLPESLKQDGKGPDIEKSRYELCRGVLQGYLRLFGDHTPGYKKVDAELARHPGFAILRHKLAAAYHVHEAWEARGEGVASTVTEDGWKKFKEHLSAAREACIAAWDAEPGDAKIAQYMLAVETGDGGDRDEMEMWFERAMKADGNNREACSAKLNWLAPKWHGSQEEVLAFGRACRDTKNWDSGIPLLIATAHEHAMSGRPLDEQKKHLYSEEVREDIRSIFEEYLKRRPHDQAERSRYAVFCVLCGKYAAASELFKSVGDDFVYPKGFSKEWVDKARKKLTAGSKIPPDEKPPQ